MSLQSTANHSIESFAFLTHLQLSSFTTLICAKLATEFYARGSYELAQALEVAAKLAAGIG